jgi:hypothetical protein
MIKSFIAQAWKRRAYGCRKVNDPEIPNLAYEVQLQALPDHLDYKQAATNQHISTFYRRTSWYSIAFIVCHAVNLWWRTIVDLKAVPQVHSSSASGSRHFQLDTLNCYVYKAGE